MSGWFRGIGLSAAILTWSAGVAAQDEEEEYADPELGEVSSAPSSIPVPLTVYGGVRLGVGGEADTDPGAAQDLVATLGIQAGADYVIMQYFALGAEVRLAGFNTDGRDEQNDDRSLLTDFVLRPRGRYEFEGVPFEVYGTLPFGLTIPSINDDWDADGQAGFTFGVGAGANYFISEQIGFGGELAYLKHWIGLESRRLSASGVPQDSDMAIGQFYFVGNVIIAL